MPTADKQTQAANRLAKRLTALRKTLRKDEREILDRLVAKKSPEVEGHGLFSGTTEIMSFNLTESGAYGVVDSSLE